MKACFTIACALVLTTPLALLAQNVPDAPGQSTPTQPDHADPRSTQTGPPITNGVGSTPRDENKRWLTWYEPSKPDENFERGFNFKTITYCAESFLYNNFDYVGVTVLEPKLRLYFDTGDDDDGELDIFKDGTLTPAVNLTELALRNASGEVGSRLFWGLDFGIGVSSAAGDETSGAALLISGGLGFEQEVGGLTDGGVVPLVGVEVGYAQGFSADESLGDVDDGAIYVGLTFRVQF